MTYTITSAHCQDIEGAPEFVLCLESDSDIAEMLIDMEWADEAGQTLHWYGAPNAAWRWVVANKGAVVHALEMARMTGRWTAKAKASAAQVARKGEAA